MKKMKQAGIFFLALVMTMGLCLTSSFAANIYISGGADGSAYEAYRLLDATNSETDPEKFAYTLNSKYTSILQSITGKTELADIVEAIDTFEADSTQLNSFAETVYSQISAAALEADETAENNQFQGIAQGYYLIVETKTGTAEDTYSLIMLDTAGNEDVTVTTKEDSPELEKKVKEKDDVSGDETDWQDGADYDIGDDVPFKLAGTVSARYADYKTYKYVFHDTLSEGLDFNEKSVVVKVDGTEVSTDSYDIVTSDEDKSCYDGDDEDQVCSFEIRFDDLKDIAGITANSEIVVEYTAKLNDNAKIGSEGNPNRAYLEYSNNPYDTTNPTTGQTPEDRVTVFTYDLVVNKVEKSEDAVTGEEKLQALSGAGFTLYKYYKETTVKETVEGEETERTVTDDYVPVGEEITGVTTFTFTGLDAGLYKLSETTVPAGYNRAEDLFFTVEGTYQADLDTDDVKSGEAPELTALTVRDLDGNEISGEGLTFTADAVQGIVTTDVVNQAGAELPSTGGIGTTIFYVTGGIMAAASLFLLLMEICGRGRDRN